MNCPECGANMHKMGKAWSGRKQVQRWRCPKCGRTTIKNEVTKSESIQKKLH